MAKVIDIVRHSCYRGVGTPIPLVHTGARPPTPARLINATLQQAVIRVEASCAREKVGRARQARGSGSHRAPQIIVGFGVLSREPWAGIPRTVKHHRLVLKTLVGAGGL